MKRLKFLLQLAALILLLGSCADHGTGCPGGAGYKIATLTQSTELCIVKS